MQRVANERWTSCTLPGPQNFTPYNLHEFAFLRTSRNNEVPGTVMESTTLEMFKSRPAMIREMLASGAEQDEVGKPSYEVVKHALS